MTYEIPGSAKGLITEEEIKRLESIDVENPSEEDKKYLKEYKIFLQGKQFFVGNSKGELIEIPEKRGE